VCVCTLSYPAWNAHAPCGLSGSTIGKGKVHPRIGHEGHEVEYSYSSTLSLTSALDGVGDQRHVPVALPPGKIRYPLYRRLTGSHSRSGRVRKISPPTGIRSPSRPARIQSLYRLSNAGPPWLYHILSYYRINGMIFRKALVNIKSVFWFSLQLLSETFLILRRIHRDIVIHIHVFV